MSVPKHVVAVAGLVTNDYGEIPLIRSPNRGGEIPGGQVEEGEDLISALAREVWEETGIAISVGPLAAVNSNLTNTLIILDFRCRAISGVLAPSAESLDVRWVSPNEAPDLASRPAMRARLRTLLALEGAVAYRAYEFPGGDPLAFSVLTERTI